MATKELISFTELNARRTFGAAVFWLAVSLVSLVLDYRFWHASPLARLYLLNLTVLAVLLTRLYFRRSRVKQVMPVSDLGTGLQLPRGDRSPGSVVIPYDEVRVLVVVGRSLLLETASTAYVFREHRMIPGLQEAGARLGAVLEEKQSAGAKERRGVQSELAAEVLSRRLIATPALTCWLSLVFGFQLWTGSWGGVPALIRVGAHQPELVQQGQYYLLLSGTHLHLDPGHLVLNLTVLLLLGRRLELVLGSSRYLATVLLSSLAGALCSQPNDFAAGVGFSGGVFGVLGGLFALQRCSASVPPILRLRKKLWIFLLGAEALVALTVPAVNTTAHLSGFVAGAVAALCLRESPRIAGVLSALLVALNLGSVMWALWSAF